MRDTKTAVKKAMCLFTAAFIMPMGIWYYSENASKLKNFAGISAAITLGKNYIYTATSHNTENGNSVRSDNLKGEDISKRNVWDIDMAPHETEKSTDIKDNPVIITSDDYSDALPYPVKADNHDGIITDYTYEKYSGEQFFNLDKGGQVRNCTTLTNESLYKISGDEIPFSIDKNSSQPQILIYHTHTTESFEKSSRSFYDSSFSCKTTDSSMNIVSVGNEICKQLDEAGIKYVHDTQIHDLPSYDNAYDSSRAAVKEILKKYPGIKICLDIHRDAIEKEDGTRLAPVVEINGKKAAQIMIISGCDDGTLGMPDCLKNFRFACNLQSALENDWNGLTRPVLFDYRFYNQDLTTGSLLIEVGSHGNSIGQVKYSGELIGKTLVRIIK